MNYIGSKQKLSGFIKQSIYSVVGTNIADKIFCDLFAGTGVISRIFKTEVKQIISNDIEYYSFVLNRNYIGNHTAIDYQYLIDELNNTKGVSGRIFVEYSENGQAQRKYFSEYNGKKIDAVRQKIEYWKNKGELTDNQYYFLLASLLESADKVGNTCR